MSEEDKSLPSRLWELWCNILALVMAIWMGVDLVKGRFTAATIDGLLLLIVRQP